MEKPNKLDSIYAEGLSIEYLTPAWAAKLTTLWGLYSLNNFSWNTCEWDYSFFSRIKPIGMTS